MNLNVIWKRGKEKMRPVLKELSGLLNIFGLMAGVAFVVLIPSIIVVGMPVLVILTLLKMFGVV